MAPLVLFVRPWILVSPTLWQSRLISMPCRGSSKKSSILYPAKVRHEAAFLYSHPPHRAGSLPHPVGSGAWGKGPRDQRDVGWTPKKDPRSQTSVGEGAPLSGCPPGLWEGRRDRPKVVPEREYEPSSPARICETGRPSRGDRGPETPFKRVRAPLPGIWRSFRCGP